MSQLSLLFSLIIVFSTAFGSDTQTLMGLYQNDKVALLDVNQDGKKDILVGSTERPSVLVYLQKEKLEFQASLTTYLHQGPGTEISNIHFGQWDEDEFVDLLVVLQNGRMEFWEGNKAGLFDYKSDFMFPDEESMKSVMGKFRSQKENGLVLLSEQFKDNKINLYHLKNNKSSEFPFAIKNMQNLDFNSLVEESGRSNLVSIEELHVGSFDSDGYEDLVILDMYRDRAFVIKNNNQSFEPVEYANFPVNPYTIGVMDINEDGKDDLFTASTFSSRTMFSHIYFRENAERFKIQDLPLYTGALVIDLKMAYVTSEERKSLVLLSELLKKLLVFNPIEGEKLSPENSYIVDIPGSPTLMESGDLNSRGVEEVVVLFDNHILVVSFD